jgi:hypothetical protein
MLLPLSMTAQHLVSEAGGVKYYVKDIKKEGHIFHFTGIADAKSVVTITDFTTNCQQVKITQDAALTSEVIIVRKFLSPIYKPIEPKSPMEFAVNYVCKQNPENRIPFTLSPISRHLPEVSGVTDGTSDILVQ